MPRATAPASGSSGWNRPLVRLDGGWEILRAEDSSEVTLHHEFEVDEEPGELPELIHRTIDEYSRRELEALRLSCERLALLLEQHSGAPGGAPSATNPAATTAREA